MAGLLFGQDMQVLVDSVEFTLSKHAGPLNFLEIGCNRGLTSKAIVRHLAKADFTYYGIDPEKPYPSGKKFKVGYENKKFIHLKGLSFEEKVIRQVPNKIHWMFIDGCHCQMCVERDIAIFLPKVVSNGVMCFHDASPKVQGRGGRESQDYPILKGHHNVNLAKKGIGVLAALEGSILEEQLYKKAIPQGNGGVAVYVVR
tara:strand:- start:6809 stop:7408 length:600 start_codon:yes stop_codon:yes gene_type:complete